MLGTRLAAGSLMNSENQGTVFGIRIMRLYKLITLFACLLLMSGATFAQENGDGGDGGEEDDLDITMTLLPANAATPEAMTKSIQLPAAAVAQTQEHSAAGRSKERRTQALEKAAEARERGRDFGQDMATQARDARENRSRGGRPDNPGPPNNPPGRP